MRTHGQAIVLMGSVAAIAKRGSRKLMLFPDSLSRVKDNSQKHKGNIILLQKVKLQLQTIVVKGSEGGNMRMCTPTCIAQRWCDSLMRTLEYLTYKSIREELLVGSPYSLAPN